MPGGASPGAAVLAVVAFVAACAPSAPPDGGGGAAPSSGAGPEPEQTTYHRDVRPILEQACTHCHREDTIAPFPLETFDEARAAGVLLHLRLEDGTMPPWGAVRDETCSPTGTASGEALPWMFDPRPPSGAAAILAAWEADGYPEGDPADAPAPQPSPEPLAADAELVPGQPFSVAGIEDLHHCFVLDPGADTSALQVQGLEVLPGLPRSVHAASVYVDAAADSDALAGPGGDYPCFGDAGIDGLAPTAVWMVGDPPWRLPSGMVFEIPPGARIVLQVHYHPGGLPEAQDLTRLRLDLAEGAPSHVVEPLRIGAPVPFETSGHGLLPGPADPPEGPVFSIPANAHDHTEAVARAIDSQDAGARILGAAGHMHYAGTSITVDVERESGDACLLHVPSHRLDWERAYRFDSPLDALPSLSAGDRVRVRCSYDNTLDNPELVGFVLASPAAAPTDLAWGRAPLTEVCAATLLIVRPAP